MVAWRTVPLLARWWRYLAQRSTRGLDRIGVFFVSPRETFWMMDSRDKLCLCVSVCSFLFIHLLISMGWKWRNESIVKIKNRSATHIYVAIDGDCLLLHCLHFLYFLLLLLPFFGNVVMISLGRNKLTRFQRQLETIRSPSALKVEWSWCVFPAADQLRQ